MLLRMRSDLELARRIERADAMSGEELILARREEEPGGAGGSSGAAVERILGGRALFTGSESPINQALGLGLDGPSPEPELDSELDRLERFFFSRAVPAVLELCPYAEPPLLAALNVRGFLPAEFSNVLALATGPAPEPGASPAGGPESTIVGPGLEIAPADPGEAELWAEVVSRGFCEGVLPPAGVVSLLASCARAPGYYPLLARRDGAPVGGGQVQIHEGVALLSGQATLPEGRGRGVQTALITTSVALARARGCDLVAAMTLPGSGSQRNFERQGFRVVYTRLKLAKPVPPDLDALPRVVETELKIA